METEAPMIIKGNKNVICGETSGLAEHQLLHEPWVGYLIPKHEWYSVKAALESVSRSKIAAFRTTGETPDDLYYHVVVSSSWSRYLEQHGSHTAGWDVLKIAQPHEKGVQGSGELSVIQKAPGEFLFNALHSVSTRDDFVLDYYYRTIITEEDLSLAVEWAILIRDIQRASVRSFERLILCCLFLSLLALGGIDGGLASQLLRKDRKEWRSDFSALYLSKTRLMHRNGEVGRCEVSMLRGLLEWAGGRCDGRQRNWAPDRSSNEYLGLVLSSLNVRGGTAVSFEGFDNPDILTALSNHRKIRFAQSDVAGLAELHQYVRIGFASQFYKIMPPKFLHALPYDMVVKGREFIWKFYEENPNLSMFNDTGIFLCYSCSSGRHHRGYDVLRRFNASEEGSHLYQQTVAGIRKTRLIDQTILHLQVLLILGLLSESSCNIGATKRSPLGDFVLLLNGHKIGNRQEILAQMLFSIAHCSGHTYYEAIYRFIMEVTGEDLQKQGFDRLSAHFWDLKLTYGLTVNDTLRQLQIVLKEWNECLLTLEEQS